MPGFSEKVTAMRARILAGSPGGRKLLPAGASRHVKQAKRRGPSAGAEPVTFERVDLPDGWTVAEVPGSRQWVQLLDDQGRSRVWLWFKPAHKGKAERSRAVPFPPIDVLLDEETTPEGVITHIARVVDRRTPTPTVLLELTTTDAEGNRGVHAQAWAHLRGLMPAGADPHDQALWALPAGVYA